MNFAQLLFYFNNQPGNKSSLYVPFFHQQQFFAVLVLFSPAGAFPLQHDAVQGTYKYKKNQPWAGCLLFGEK